MHINLLEEGGANYSQSNICIYLYNKVKEFNKYRHNDMIIFLHEWNAKEMRANGIQS